MKVLIYHTASGKQPLTHWLENLGDKDGEIRIRQRLRRLELGHLGDCKALGQNLYELRFFFGAGYRIYFGLEGKELVLLLCGGDKSSQSRDIKKARTYWQDYKEQQR
jgi:putative addiction module killer protein